MSYIRSGFSDLPEITKNLMIINGIMLLATYAFPGIYQFVSLFYFSNEMFKPWQLVTHMFTHADFIHLFFNMFSLYMFGGVIERALGPKKFLTYYLVTGFGGAFLHVLVKVIQVYMVCGEIWITPELISSMSLSYEDQSLLYDIYRTPMVGASGAVFGILTAFGVMYPYVTLQLIFPPIPVKARTFILVIIALELLNGFTSQGNIAHFAHLGGALFGYLLLNFWRKRYIF